MARSFADKIGRLADGDGAVKSLLLSISILPYDVDEAGGGNDGVHTPVPVGRDFILNTYVSVQT